MSIKSGATFVLVDRRDSLFSARGALSCSRGYRTSTLNAFLINKHPLGSLNF